MLISQQQRGGGRERYKNSRSRTRMRVEKVVSPEVEEGGGRERKKAKGARAAGTYGFEKQPPMGPKRLATSPMSSVAIDSSQKVGARGQPRKKELKKNGKGVERGRQKENNVKGSEPRHGGGEWRETCGEGMGFKGRPKNGEEQDAEGKVETRP